MENVFIAWSGNYPLACLVASELESRGYQAILGGGSPTDMFIGSQIQAQMNSATYAIILAQKKPLEGPAEFSDNVMFEWGYLIARLTSKKVFVFLIDTGERELPSDLIGSWVIPVSREGRDETEIATEIIGQFRTEKIVVDKLEIMSRWKEVKIDIKKFGEMGQLGDYEAAQLIFFSILTAYYYDDIDFLLDAIYGLNAQSDTLRVVIGEALAILQIFKSTSNLARPLEIDEYFEITSMLTNEFEIQLDESDLRDWLKIMRYEKLSLCNCIVDIDWQGDDARHYHLEAIAWGEKALSLIEESLFTYPENTQYSNLIKSFLFRNIALAYYSMEEDELAKKYFEQSVESRKKVYFYYKHAHPSDSVLCSKFAQEYYLALLEKCKYENNLMERKRIQATVQRFLNAWEEDFSRQQSLLNKVKNAYSDLNKLSQGE